LSGDALATKEPTQKILIAFVKRQQITIERSLKKSFARSKLGAVITTLYFLPNGFNN
jgi:hypothetical protein